MFAAAKENRYSASVSRAPVRAMLKIIASFSFLQFQISQAVTRGAEVLVTARTPSCKHRQLNVTIAHSFFVARARALFYQEVRISARQEVAMDTCGSSTAPRITSEGEERGAQVWVSSHESGHVGIICPRAPGDESLHSLESIETLARGLISRAHPRASHEKNRRRTPFSLEETPFSLRTTR